MGFIKVRQAIQQFTTKEKDIDFQEFKDFSVRELKQKVAEYKPHIFHFLGHGKFNKTDGAFALTNQEGEVLWYDNQSFSQFFESWQPKLIILQSCQSGQISSFKDFSGGAAWLIRKQIPAVVAWRYPLTQKEGWDFMEEFYKSLAKGNPVDKAVQNGRNNLAFIDDKPVYNTRCFGTPILWNNLKNSQLFFIEKPDKKITKIIEELDKQIYVNKDDQRKINALAIAELIGDIDYKLMVKLLITKHKYLRENPCADRYQDKLQNIYYSLKKLLKLFKDEDDPQYSLRVYLNTPIQIFFPNKNSLPDGINGTKSVIDYLNDPDLFEIIIHKARCEI